MPSKYTLFFFLFLLFNHSFGQGKSNNIGAYYQNINKAELAIVDSNYTEAKNFYAKAASYKSLNGKDIFNAFLISFYSRDTFNSQYYYSLLVTNGYKKTMFKDTVCHTEFYNYLSTAFDSLYSSGLKTNKVARSEYLNRMFARDQYIRTHDTTKAAIRAFDKINTDSLIWFSKKFGYPGFSTVGFFEKGGFSAYSFGTFWLVMWHQRPIPLNLLDWMRKEVLKGNLNPDDYAFALDDQQQNTYGCVIPKNGFTKAQKAVINKNRAQIYLESLDDFKKKLIYSFRRSDFMFMNVFYKPLNQKLKDQKV